MNSDIRGVDTRIRSRLGVSARALSLAAAFATFGMMIGSAAHADSYPSKNITAIIPFAPGGGTDNTLRIVEEATSKALGQKLVLTNLPGGHGSRAMVQLKQAAPDGYTIAIVPTGPIASVPHTTSVPYKLNDFITVIQLTDVPNTLIVPPDSPFKTLKDVVDAARAKPPGALKVAIAGKGSPSSHLPVVQFAKLAKVQLTYIPHKGGGPALVPVMGGHVDLGSVDLSVSGPKIKGGNVHAIGLFATKRNADFPDIPTLKEQGYDVEGGFFNMILVPKGTPAPIVKRLHDAFKTALEDPSVVARLKELNLSIDYLGTEDSQKKAKRYYDTIGHLVKELGLEKK